MLDKMLEDDSTTEDTGADAEIDDVAEGYSDDELEMSQTDATNYVSIKHFN